MLSDLPQTRISFLRMLAAAVFGIPAAYMLWWFDNEWFLDHTKAYVNQVADTIGLNQYLTQALFVVSGVAVVLFVAQVFSLSKTRRLF